MSKLYKREGRRFVPTTDLTGQYLNDDGSITEEKTDKSLAICVLHTLKEAIFCELNPSPSGLNWYDARKYCSEKFSGHGRLPEIHELLMVRNCFRNIFPKFGLIWSNTESSLYSVKFLRLSHGYIDVGDKDHFADFRVFAFLTIEL